LTFQGDFCFSPSSFTNQYIYILRTWKKWETEVEKTYWKASFASSSIAKGPLLLLLDWSVALNSHKSFHTKVAFISCLISLLYWSLLCLVKQYSPYHQRWPREEKTGEEEGTQWRWKNTRESSKKQNSSVARFIFLTFDLFLSETLLALSLCFSFFAKFTTKCFLRNTTTNYTHISTFQLKY